MIRYTPIRGCKMAIHPKGDYIKYASMMAIVLEECYPSRLVDEMKYLQAKTRRAVRLNYVLTIALAISFAYNAYMAIS